MRKSLFKRCLGVVATAGVLALAFGPSAQAATTGTSPHWFNGHIDRFRAGGSETTFYVMNAINNLYSQSSIFGCTLLTSDFQTCNTAGDTSDTDILDNYDRDEFTNGAGIGSTNGLSILCGVPAAAIAEDFARSSRPGNGSSCENSLTFLPYAKDGLVGVAFDSEHAVTSGSATTPIGPVAAGWRNDGDALNCNLLPNPGPHFDNGVNGCDGVPFDNISNTGGSSSVAFRIWCDTSGTAISDWGQLTDPAHAVGSGTSIGVPIQLWGVNTGSGTYSVWRSFIGCEPEHEDACRRPPPAAGEQRPAGPLGREAALPVRPDPGRERRRALALLGLVRCDEQQPVLGRAAAASPGSTARWWARRRNPRRSRPSGTCSTRSSRPRSGARWRASSTGSARRTTPTTASTSRRARTTTRSSRPRSPRSTGSPGFRATSPLRRTPRPDQVHRRSRTTQDDVGPGGKPPGPPRWQGQAVTSG